jgi:hypothetical protein
MASEVNSHMTRVNDFNGINVMFKKPNPLLNKLINIRINFSYLINM